MRSIRAAHILTLVLAIAIPSFAVAPSAWAASPRRGSFTATAVPYADVTYNSPTASSYTCVDGQEGVHKVTYPYKSPAAGTLTAEITGFTGDWDLMFLDEGGDIIGMNWHSQWIEQEGVERLTIRLKAGQKLGIVACNWASNQTEVEVRFRLVSGDGFASKSLDSLAPGRLAGLKERVPINFVFVGLDKDTVEVSRFLGGLPDRYRPMTRARQWAYGEQDYIGIDYTFDYDTHFADRAYEDRFFGKLRSLSKPGSITTYQGAYNQQETNVLDVDENFEIDAATVEKWLAKNPPAGVDTSENTMFFINWFGRKDFRFHVYTKLGEPDPDAGFDAGMYPSQMLSAWGGTTPDDEETGLGSVHRVWFYDLSAGPERVARNYIVDLKDLDGDGAEDYRIPPIWEYRKDGYRSRTRITGDLAKVARYVGVNLLFTPSPIYYPGLTPPLLPKRINLDINVYDASVDYEVSKDWLQQRVIRHEVAELLPLQDITIDVQDLDVTDPKFLECYVTWYELAYGPSCYRETSLSIWANPFVYHAKTLDQTRDGRDSDGYEAMSFNYALDQEGWAGGYADENYYDGTQSFDHVAMMSDYAGEIGMTAITIHEYGHHFGVSHPHDGYDYEEGIDYGFWNDRLAFSYLGTESNSIMNYLSVNKDFSQFDRDNMNRWHTAAYINASNEILERIQASDDAGRVRSAIDRADSLAGRAFRAFSGHRYLEAAAAAVSAYDLVLGAARDIGLNIKPDESGVTARDTGAESAGDYHGYSPHAGGAPNVDMLQDRPIYEDLLRLGRAAARLPRGLDVQTR